MSRSDAFKPPPHACDEKASHLRPRYLCGRWTWVLYMASAFSGTGRAVKLSVTYCPFCGQKLPTRRVVKLEAVKGGRGG